MSEKVKQERRRVLPDKVVQRGTTVDSEIGCGECERPSASLVKVDGAWVLIWLSPHDRDHANAISLARLNRKAAELDSAKD